MKSGIVFFMSFPFLTRSLTPFLLESKPPFQCLHIFAQTHTSNCTQLVSTVQSGRTMIVPKNWREIGDVSLTFW